MPRLNRCLILAAAWLAGCATTIEDRGRSAAAFTERLKAETDAYFADHPEPLALTDAFADFVLSSIFRELRYRG